MSVKSIFFDLDPNFKSELFWADSKDKVRLTTPKGTELILTHPKVSFELVQGKLKVSTSKKWSKVLKELEGTWKSSISRLSEDATWVYQVTALYKHFPITFNLKEGSVEVYNFMGVKTPLKVSTEKTNLSLKTPNTLLIKSRDRVFAGNVASRFYNLRYKVHLRNMDRRVFTDGFLVEFLGKDE